MARIVVSCDNSMDISTQQAIPEVAADFYDAVLSLLERAGIPHLLGGTFAYSWYSGVMRATKDVDIFVRREDVALTLEICRAGGYGAELTFAHWLGKVRSKEHFIDLIFNSGNGIAHVDDLWFQHAVPARILGRDTRLCPPEELIWSKSFVQERERFDGADVLHLVRELGPALDWHRLLRRFGDHWRVLLSHITLFGFVYPDRRGHIPPWVLATLMRRLAADEPALENQMCYGTLLSREQYLWDIEHSGYDDPRIEPEGRMTKAEVDEWTAAIGARTVSHDA